MPNPSELERLRLETLVKARKAFQDAALPKVTKESLLREIRRLEALLGLPSKPYNG